ncbi:MAG: SusD/RagB family nutrient-binding outer membrane lipoprotein [Cyclobacteriaceae bacterium]|nr:SusD/RagB family nutrient-binding outer membrane lipoprotein [Cyclobacteriaceae bacterium]
MKKRTNNTIKGVVFALGLLTAIACTEGLDSNLNNPSALAPEQASNEYIWNGIQLSFANFYLNVTDFGQDLTRMRNLYGSIYENAYTQNNFNGIWLSAYSDVMVNSNLLLDKTKENPATTTVEYNPFYQGTTKVMKAYVLLTLVDYFGDVPYAEAFNTSNFNPAAQSGAAVYDSAQNLLQSAVADLNLVVSGTPKPAYDLYYNGVAAGWRKAANSLLFKLHLNRRLIDPAGSDAAMAALITANDMINSNADDFSFKFTANSQTNPNTFHPWFYGSYLTSSGPYMSNSYMKELYDGKGFKDPRLRYYFYRQVNQPTTDVNELTCSIPVFPYTTFPPAHYPPGTAYCQLPEGYWGRDHLNFEGTPPDGLKKTTYGLYPAGGRFDANDAKPVTDQGLSSGGKGKGILPIMMSSFVLFMRAEHALMKPASDPVGARALLEQAIRRSIDRVMTFIPSAVNPSFAPSATGINTYVNTVLARYDVATPTAPNTTLQETKLDVICKEYWIALWGNGVESYNMYRRTGRPTGMQPALAADPGNFYRSLTYPGVYIVRNNQATQKPDNKVKVFWDPGTQYPDGFIY